MAPSNGQRRSLRLPSPAIEQPPGCEASELTLTEPRSSHMRSARVTGEPSVGTIGTPTCDLCAHPRRATSFSVAILRIQALLTAMTSY